MSFPIVCCKQENCVNHGSESYVNLIHFSTIFESHTQTVSAGTQTPVQTLVKVRLQDG